MSISKRLSSKTIWGYVYAMSLVVLGLFGVSTETITDVAAQLHIEPATLGVISLAVINGLFKFAKSKYYKKKAEKEA